MSQDAGSFPHARFGQLGVTHTALQHDMAMANFLKPAPTTANSWAFEIGSASWLGSSEQASYHRVDTILQCSRLHKAKSFVHV
jgi:hypothetical protein